MTTQISKIQFRRGLQSGLPGATSPALDVGEPAFAIDTNRLFIGSDPIMSNAVATYHDITVPGGFPYANVEILTEFSPANQLVFDNKASDMRTAFIQSVPLAITGPSWQTLMINQYISAFNPPNVIPFVINAQNVFGQFGTAQISYFMVDSSTLMPMRTGRMMIFHQGNSFPPSLIDDAVSNPNAGFPIGGMPVSPNQRYGMVAFQAVPISTGISIQYRINMSGSGLPIPVLYFRVEQPYLGQ